MRRTWLVATLLGLATAELRLPRALGDALWQDEVASARIIREPTFGGMLHHVARTESTPPLWYTLGWLSHNAGVSIHDVRLLSVVAGALLVTVAVRLAAEVMPLSLAAAAGVLLAVGAEFTTHGRELRAYELFCLLAAVFAIVLYRAAVIPSYRRLALVGITAASGAMTHYFFAFTLIAGLCWLWLDPAARSSRRRVSAAVVVALIAGSPWLPFFVAQYRHDRYSWIGPFDPLTAVGTPLRIFSPAVATPVTSVIFLAWLAAGVWVALRRSPLERLIATLAFVPLVLAAATWAAGVNVFAIRNMIGIGPFVAVVALLAPTALPRGGRLPAAAAITVAGIALFVIGQKPTPPYNRIAQALVREGWRAPDSVLIQGNFFDYRSPLEWYLPDLPQLVRAPLDQSPHHPTFAVLAHRPVPWRIITQAERVGRYLVARLRPQPTVRWFRRGVVLTAVKKFDAAYCRDLHSREQCGAPARRRMMRR